MIVILLGGAEWMYKQKMSKFQLLEDDQYWYCKMIYQDNYMIKVSAF